MVGEEEVGGARSTWMSGRGFSGRRTVTRKGIEHIFQSSWDMCELGHTFIFLFSYFCLLKSESIINWAALRYRGIQKITPRDGKSKKRAPC